MEYILTQFANTSPGQTDLFSSLGINWQMLTLQGVAFLILLVILRKWVYPPLVGMLDKRDEQIRISVEAAEEAKKDAEAAEEKTAELLKAAREEAADIVATAREEASSVVDAASKKATDKAEALVTAARDDISREFEAAKKELYHETLSLVADATGLVLKQKIDNKADAKLIEQAIKEAR